MEAPKGGTRGTAYFDTLNFNKPVDYLLKIALMHDTAPEIVSHLRAVARQIGIAITDTIEADGSIFHHNFYNFSYVGYGFPSLARQINYLSSTPSAVDACLVSLPRISGAIADPGLRGSLRTLDFGPA